MKSLTFVLLLLVLCFVATGFQCGACRPPNCVEETVCDSTGWSCHTVRRHRHFTEANFQFSQSQAEGIVGILDLANPWSLDSSLPPQLTIKFENNLGASEQSFDLVVDNSVSVSSVDKDTTPNTLKFADPSSVSAFLSQASSSNFSVSEQTVTLSFSITQTDCTAASGKYINHLHDLDTSGITYDGNFTLVYTATTNVQANSCNQGTVIVGD
jgi:hypothetical protein